MQANRSKMKTALKHPFRPVADSQSRALVLGSFPSVKSRENSFYYGHPQNRFWRVLAALFAQRIPETIEEKTVFLHRHHIALWDVVSECDIKGSADSTLRPYMLNDIEKLVGETQIDSVFLNGQKAGKLYQTRNNSMIQIPSIILPSTSPANAAWTLDRLIEAWTPLRNAVGEHEKYNEQS